MRCIKQYVCHYLNPVHLYCRLTDFFWVYSAWWNKTVENDPKELDLYNITKLIRKRRRLEQERARLKATQTEKGGNIHGAGKDCK